MLMCARCAVAKPAKAFGDTSVAWSVGTTRAVSPQDFDILIGRSAPNKVIETA